MRQYIITGACGHLARTIIKLLSKTKCRIFGLILPGQTPEKNEQVSYYYGDVTLPDTLDPLFADARSKDTVVIHAAGLISIADKVTEKLYDVNVNGTKNIIAKCREYAVRRLVYVSSVHAIPEKPKGEVMTEVEDFDPHLVVGAYAKTKAEATAAVLAAAKDGLDAVVVHPSGILGVGDTEKSNHLNQVVFDAMEGKLPAGVKGGYDLVDVEDVAEGCIAAAEYGKCGECYILSGEYCTVKDLLEMVRRDAKLKKRFPILPLWMAKAVVPFFEWYAKRKKRRPLFTRYSLYTLSANALFSHQKATRDLAYHPRAISKTVLAMVKGNFRIRKRARRVKGKA